jgi:anti-anti-sigma factor
MSLRQNAIRSEFDAETSTLTINVGRYFDFNLVYDFREAYSALDETPQSVTVNLNETQSIDSSALGMLINMKRNLELDDHQIKIINAKDDVKKILNIVHFDKIFEIQD